MNLIAERALAAGVTALRYAGPYPTPALFSNAPPIVLHDCRRSDVQRGRPRSRRSRRARRAADRFLACPASPRSRTRHARARSAEGLERDDDRRHRVRARWITGALSMVPAESGSATRRTRESRRCRRRSARRRTASAIPPCTSAVIGREFPPPLRAALAELVASRAPAARRRRPALVAAQRRSRGPTSARAPPRDADEVRRPRRAVGSDRAAGPWPARARARRGARARGHARCVARRSGVASSRPSRRTESKSSSNAHLPRRVGSSSATASSSR